MRIAFAAFACTAVTACSSIDRQAMTTFDAQPGGQFAFTSAAGGDYPPDSQSAEATRLSWLQQYLTDNRLCGSGYEITERREIITGRNIAGTAYRIHYRGRCKG